MRYKLGISCKPRSRCQRLNKPSRILWKPAAFRTSGQPGESYNRYEEVDDGSEAVVSMAWQTLCHVVFLTCHCRLAARPRRQSAGCFKGRPSGGTAAVIADSVSTSLYDDVWDEYHIGRAVKKMKLPSFTLVYTLGGIYLYIATAPLASATRDARMSVGGKVKAPMLGGGQIGWCSWHSS
jgi:hypothetical protein